MIADKYKYPLLLLMVAPFMTNFFMRVLAWKVLLGKQGVVNSFLFWTGPPGGRQPHRVHGLRAGTGGDRAGIRVDTVRHASDVRRHDQHGPAAPGGGRRPRGQPVAGLLEGDLPAQPPGVVASFFFVFIPTIGEFVVPKLVGGTRGYMFGSAISDLFGMGLDWRTGSVLSLWLVAAVFVLALVFFRLVRFGKLAES